MEAIAVMSGAAGLVPVGKTRVIFEGDKKIARDFNREDYLKICPNGSCDSKTLNDFRELPSTEALARFY